jgi:hypothetical protein
VPPRDFLQQGRQQNHEKDVQCVAREKIRERRKHIGVQILRWVCILIPAPSSFSQNEISKTDKK